ncbi:transcription factor E2F7 [Aulostomus maculatus]
MEVACLALKDLTSPRESFPFELDESGGPSEQKENICTTGRRRSTPLNPMESNIPPLLINRRGTTPDLAHITPIKHTVLVEPLTPTANLKMLISAASPDIRNREMKKVLFRPIENEAKAESPDAVAEDTELEYTCQFEAVEEEGDTEKKPSRKQKSLGLLCQKFLALYPDYPPLHNPIAISLDEVASSLGVERRRIYDIVNVLESLMIVGRIAKNSYTWHGRLRLEATLEDLQQQGHQQGYHLQMELAAEGREAGLSREDDTGEEDTGHAAGNRKDKSLRIMSQKFVMLFLVSKTQTVTLEAAAKILIEESQDSSSHSKYKTKVRRLYDIANVLTSLGLIKKVHVREERGRKPAFRWLGPVEFSKPRNSAVGSRANVTPPEATQPMAGGGLRKAKLARHASFGSMPTSVAIQRQVSSAPSSPRRELPGLTQKPADYSRRASSTVCRLQFEDCAGNQTPTQNSSKLPPSPTQPTLLAPTLHPEHLLKLSSSSHCLAYLPSLSQPSVVMLYNVPDQCERKAEGQRSPSLEPEEGRKRRREEEEENDRAMAKKKETSELEEFDEISAEPQRNIAPCLGLSSEASDESQAGNGPVQPSHYLYVPNSAGLNNLNFLLSSGQPPAHVALPPSSVPALALPYVLVPSAALSHYPLVATSLQQQGSDAQLSFSLPAVMSPSHLMVGMAPYGLAAASETSKSPALSPSTSEQGRIYRSAAGTPHSPTGQQQAVSITTPEPLTPHTPKDIPLSVTKAFFQTPGTLGSVVRTAPDTRKRGSAQRRLDIGHPPAGQSHD